jgi:uncharacterized delta-60 repeat protein
MKSYIRALIATLILSVFSNSAFAAWGDYDTTFGFLGIALDGSANHYPKDIAVQPDGKILLTGYRVVGGVGRFFLKRYLSNGQVDTSFGNNGYATPTALINVNYDYSGRKVVVQANGRIAVLGTGGTSVYLWRFLSSGDPDTSIGYGGMKKVPTGYNTGHSSELATYANILYVGLVKDDYSSGAILKYFSSGSQDTSFGTGGVATPSSYIHFKMATEVGTGNILVGGREVIGGNGYGFERFLPTGQLDPTFTRYDTTYAGAAGQFPSNFVQRANGELVLNEWWNQYNSFPENTLGSNLARFQSDGDYIGRIAYIPVHYDTGSHPGSCPSIIAEQSDGRVVARGTYFDKLYRFSSTFSTTQTMNCDSYTALGEQTKAVLQSDNKMLAAGRYNGNIAIARTLP